MEEGGRKRCKVGSSTAIPSGQSTENCRTSLSGKDLSTWFGSATKGVPQPRNATVTTTGDDRPLRVRLTDA